MFSLIIITRNRPKFLHRALAYYAESSMDMIVLVSDASSGDARRTTENICKQQRDRLTVQYIAEVPNDGPFERLERLLNHVKTPMVAWVADDDFMVPAAICTGVRILEQDNSVSAVTGRAALFCVEGDGEYGSISNLMPYPQKECMEDDVGLRLRRHLEHYTSTAYCVRRTTQMRDNMLLLKNTEFKCPQANALYELLDSVLTVIDGRICCQDRMMLFRQAHANMTSAIEGRQDDLYRRNTGELWSADMQTLVEVTALRLGQKERVPQEAAAALVDDALHRYMAHSMNKMSKSSTDSPRLFVSDVFRNIARSIRTAAKYYLARPVDRDAISRVIHIVQRAG